MNKGDRSKKLGKVKKRKLNTNVKKVIQKKWNKYINKYKRVTEKKRDEDTEDTEMKARSKKKRDVIAQTDSVYLSPLLLPSPGPSACPLLR